MTAVPHPEDRPGPALRAEALESLLLEKGLIDPKVVDGLINRYANDVGPMNGAKVVAKAWTDPAYKARLLEDGTAAIAELGFSGPQGEHIIVVENTAAVHNVVVCTLCSCYPWPVLGLPPAWYKDPAYRSRVVREPRTLLAEMGLALGRRRRDPGLGQQLRGALPGAARASRRNRGTLGGGAAAPRHPRRHGRRRPGDGPAHMSPVSSGSRSSRSRWTWRDRRRRLGSTGSWSSPNRGRAGCSA